DAFRTSGVFPPEGGGHRLSRMASAAKVLEVDGPDGVREVRISSPERQVWPGVSKWDLAQYVRRVGPALLEALADRPVTLQRFPDGTAGEEFFSKNPPR